MTAAAVPAPATRSTDVPPEATPADRAATEVNQPTGPIHTGSGNQLLFHYPRREARANDLAPSQLQRLWRCFVTPPNFDRAAKLLAEPEGVVILSGAANSGRRTAGLMLLSAGITPATAVRFVPPEPELQAAQVERRIFGAGDVRADDRLLFDLSEVDANLFAEQQSCLHELLPALLSRQAKLVVVLPHHYREQLRPDFQQYVVEIGRPDMLEVFERQLAAHGVHVRNAYRYRKTFAAATMTELVRLAYQVRDAHEDQPDTDADALLAEVLSSGERLERKASGAVQSADEQRSRALLIATALLHGQSTRTIFVAQQRLLELLQPSEDDREHPLKLSGVKESLERFGIELSITSDQRVEFAEPAVAAEILGYFWDDMPWLREPLADWLDALADADLVDRYDLIAIVQRFGEQCRRTRQADLALRVVDKWSSARQWAQRSAAYALFEDLLDDDRTASPARQILYTWARDTHLSPGRVAIVVAACVNVLSNGFLDQAVVRLCWLTKHSDPGVQADACHGLKRLSEPPETRLTVIDQVLEPWRFTPTMFAAVAAPEGLPLFAGTEAAARIVAGWQQALDATPRARRRELLRPWLVAHSDLLGNGQIVDAGHLVHLLALCCAGRREFLDDLLNAMFEWFEGREDPLSQRTARAVNELVRGGRLSNLPTATEAEE
ncbi:hypothetical protein [Kribbella sp. NPDC048915]|uniref:hypothetical protein n=1 Tax=Kribbella sp. NPDC048915 TaxID=3155148 RepID=UPI0033E46677